MAFPGLMWVFMLSRAYTLVDSSMLALGALLGSGDGVDYESHDA